MAVGAAAGAAVRVVDRADPDLEAALVGGRGAAAAAPSCWSLSRWLGCEAPRGFPNSASQYGSFGGGALITGLMINWRGADPVAAAEHRRFERSGAHLVLGL